MRRWSQIVAVVAMVVLELAGSGVAQSASKGIWITREEIRALPTTGPAWLAVKAVADKSPVTPDLGNQDESENVRTLARAYVWVRLGIESYRTSVISSVLSIPETENGGRTLALGRKLPAYVIAADLVGLPADKEPAFKDWLRKVRIEVLDSKTLISTHETRANNWGTICGFARVVADIYLDDVADLARASTIFRGWLGDRGAYASFTYADLWWQADPSRPVAINPKLTTIQGHSVDGALPEELRRSGAFTWPPPKDNYQYTGLEGAIGQAAVLSRWGYPDVWTWSDSALLRAYKWLYNVALFPAVGNDTWQPYVIDQAYNVTFPLVLPSTQGTSIGFTDWTHVKPLAAPPPPANFNGEWSFTYSTETKLWTAVRLDSAQVANGTGNTPAAALTNWMSKNPGEP